MYKKVDEIIPILKKIGYDINDPWDVVEAFEDMVAKYSGSKYAVAVDNCTNALFLCLKYLNASGEINIPKRTYLSVPQSIIHSGCVPTFRDEDWSGIYKLEPYNIIDSAGRFRKNMYVKGTLQCLSFHIRKILAIAKGGMILTDDYEAYSWLKLAEYEGRNRRIPHDEMDEPTICGWNMYMPPEQAAMGIEIFLGLPDYNEDCTYHQKYKDLSIYKIYNK